MSAAAGDSRDRPVLQLKRPAWPAIDQVLWATATEAVDILSDANPAASWTPASKRTVIKGYGRWLGWLVLTDQLDAATPPLARATPERVAAYIAHLRATASSGTLAAYAKGLGSALKAMQPQADLQWLWRLATRLKRRATPVGRKRHRIVGIRELLAFGFELMDQAERDGGQTAAHDAARYRNGLMIAMLAMRPIRIRNLQMMTLGTHLLKQSGRYYLHFRDAETKTHKPIECALWRDSSDGRSATARLSGCCAR